MPMGITLTLVVRDPKTQRLCFMHNLLPSKLGKLKIVCALPLFSNSICIKKQSAAEHGFTQIVLNMILAPHLQFSVAEQCDFLELAIFCELPKAYLGDSNMWVQQQHANLKSSYESTKSKYWLETEKSFGLETSRCANLYGLLAIVESFASMLFIEKECLLGNQYFAQERYKTQYDTYRRLVLAHDNMAKTHPCSNHKPPLHTVAVNWEHAVSLLDSIYSEAFRALREEGIAGFTCTFLGVVEKLKEHPLFKGWSSHFPESVGEHTFQVVFLCRLLASKLSLPVKLRVQLYHVAVLHGLAEVYAREVVYPVHFKEREVTKLHHSIEQKLITRICERFRLTLTNDPRLLAIVDICDHFVTQLYCDREVRSGNVQFKILQNTLNIKHELYVKDFPEVFHALDDLWLEYASNF
jgi:5'-deoxynucleotidase YfbR-like HD superfamily hydrolase